MGAEDFFPILTYACIHTEHQNIFSSICFTFYYGTDSGNCDNSEACYYTTVRFRVQNQYFTFSHSSLQWQKDLVCIVMDGCCNMGSVPSSVDRSGTYWTSTGCRKWNCEVLFLIFTNYKSICVSINCNFNFRFSCFKADGKTRKKGKHGRVCVWLNCCDNFFLKITVPKLTNTFLHIHLNYLSSSKLPIPTIANGWKDLINGSRRQRGRCSNCQA